MHILIVNDDGPPSNQSSPYVHSLVKCLEDAGHTISIVLPNVQRSWIGKAHIIGQTVKPTYFTPGTLHEDDGKTRSRPSQDGGDWVLVDGTPASCVQIGLYHFFKEKGPIDLVISGPNYGRNSTAVFALSSGTLGGALEAAVCKKKAIAISFAFDSRNHDPIIIKGACLQSVKVVEHLYKNWDENVDLYSVNVPLIENVGSKKVMLTNMLQNYWSPSSCFEEVADDDGDADEEEQKIREREGADTKTPSTTRHSHKHFKWSPRFLDVKKSVEASQPGNDGWAVAQGYTSITPLKANFMHALSGKEGELKLHQSDSQPANAPQATQHPLQVMVDYEDPYVQPLIVSALASQLPADSYTLLPVDSSPPSNGPYLQIRAYESLSFDHMMSSPSSSLANAYIIRKALIRKHYLSTTAHNWVTKNPTSILASHITPSCSFELDYAEFLDDALVEAWELQAAFDANAELPASERSWWILKPGMSDRGQGIRLFSTYDELQSIFEEWEAERPDSDNEETDADTEAGAAAADQGDYIMTSQLRHFVAQPYIHPPLLLAPGAAKFHIRTYVLAAGALRVYVYRPMLALFAGAPYVSPASDDGDGTSVTALAAHLTNTCLQDGSRDGTVRAFWSLPQPVDPQPLPSTWKERVFADICEATGEIFEAAARGMSVHFQTVPNAFEVFGLDFLVDERGVPWLLEVNAFPDFRQTGEELQGLVAGLWREVVDVAVKPFFGVEGGNREGTPDMVLVRDVALGRG